MGKGHRYHDKPDVDKVIKKLVDEHGWRYIEAGHGYRLLCPCGDDYIEVSSTPRNPSTHARQIKRKSQQCPDRHELSPHPRAKGRPS
ncbi:hypothetical protein JOF55_001605 [Haloactinomyces albus]|uniref:Uncharacterized protein n=1 Tax=Haloactinomyces albus TaxID=1352928 RepID=A0AAE3ZEB2_9ACTN|nr:hypothetical protein [Haloactinomyces albus]